MTENKPRNDNTERIGVNAVEAITIKDFNWIFREQPIQDMGIDAHIELVDDGKPTGKLLAVQIKTGISHFNEKEDVLTYYGKLQHLDYWNNHSLPVILIAHLPDEDKTYWVLINEQTIERTKKSWKVDIPKNNIFSETSKNRLSIAFEGSPAQQKLRKLALDEPLMRHIEKGGKVSIELEEWINKSLSRSPVQIYIIDENGDEELAKDLFYYYTGRTLEEFAQEIFPWASISIDINFYDENQDDEDYEYAEWKADMNFSERKPLLIYPYRNACGEVDYYRLELKLNDLGTSFLRVSNFLAEI